ncbi:MAG: ribulose-phosphate 3-epimerase [Kiritimatiellae bacterium]|nr:ribulose-phosphate 3-epimerase [Kiritimatiellia bacterium]
METQQIKILPSLLAADYGHLADEIRRAEAGGADALHIDIMDAHFVPNLSFGPDIVALVRRVAPGFYRHVHLMMTNPHEYIDPFVAAGAQTMQVHVEASCNVLDLIHAIRARGVRASLAINPETPVETLYRYIDDVEEFLVMTVHPGYGGQSFIESCIEKIAKLRAHTGKDIMVDGGVNAETAKRAVAAGANMLVAGSYLFHAQDMAAAIDSLR